jgi:hypothetical protein
VTTTVLNAASFTTLEIVALVALAVVGWIVLAYLLVGRILRHGGRWPAVATVLVAVTGLMAVVLPGGFVADLTLPIGVVCLIVAIRPLLVIKSTGGPRPAWEALRVGRELRVLVAEAGGPKRARHVPDIVDRVAALDALPADPATDGYLRLLRRTILADPAQPSGAADLRALAEADAALRATLRVAPIWERDLAERAEAAASGG